MQFYIQSSLHANIFTQKHSYTQTRLHAKTFTQKILHTNLLHKYTSTHTNNFTHKHLYTETLVHTNPFSCTRKIAILLRFLPIDPHFVRKGWSSTRKIAILPQFLPIDPHSARKGSLRHTKKSDFFSNFWRSILISYERVTPAHEKS